MNASADILTRAFEDRAAAILAHAFGARRWYADDGCIGVHGADGARAAAALAAAPLTDAEESMLLLYAFGEWRDAERVVTFAGLCGIRATAAWFALARLLYPTRFAAGDFSERRPKGRRAEVDFEIRRADRFFRRWLRDAAAIFLAVHSANSAGVRGNPETHEMARCK